MPANEQDAEHPDALVYVAEMDGQIGAASLWIVPRLNWTTPQAWIPDLYVDPRHHRAEAHQLYESYGFDHYARAYALKL